MVAVTVAAAVGVAVAVVWLWRSIRNSTFSLTTLVLCFFISQICFWDHKYVFFLGKVFYHLVEVVFNVYASICLTLCPNLSNFWTSFYMSHKKCPTLQVLFIIKFGTIAFFFFVLYCILFKFIMFYSKCPKCHTRFFLSV